MDPEAIKKHLQGNTFRHNNGHIMRMVNIMKPQESTVGNIRFLLCGETQENVQNSLNYLIDVGYIRIAGLKGEAFSVVLEEDNYHFRIALTHTGLEVLMGFRDNPAVEA